MLFDSHAHINEDRFSVAERLRLVEEIRDNAIISYVADIGYDLPSSERAAEIAGKYPFIIAAVGVHPHDSGTMTEEIYRKIRALASSPGVKAIGEIGLDYYYMRSPREDQIYWFRRQIQLAMELSLPIVIHSRDADRETMDVLVEEGAFGSERKACFTPRLGPCGAEVPDARVDIHCFSGSAELAEEYIKLGATLGICGPLTYKNNKKTVRVVEDIPLEYLMVETDMPYLAPEPMRGKPNRPWYVEYTARRLADIKGLKFEEVAAATTKNAINFYGIKYD